ncbi:hypothetical protein [Parapedobacter sp. 10938]|uniref:hypothetical protein n=1 Tax=Parapedobacter flavus TaxID=3110225 RepID=UPI002DBA6F6E|nr:hypothetical protein [Parapedobacter sp. 10938]MEC3881612.1 hypothetical protein [Parapedobacter sp. 10938]
MKKVIKINLVAVLAAVFSFGLMSFNLLSHRDPGLQWHEIQSNGANQGQDLVGQPIDTPGDEDENCELSMDEYRCAVQLFYDPEEYNPENKTVNTILTEGEASLEETAFREE